jgi:hypothetical protein
MQDKAPAQYAQMKAQGSLETYLESLQAAYSEAVDDGRNAAQNEPLPSDPMQKVQQLNSRYNVVESEALNQAIESIEALTTAFGPESLNVQSPGAESPSAMSAS